MKQATVHSAITDHKALCYLQYPITTILVFPAPSQHCSQLKWGNAEFPTKEF